MTIKICVAVDSDGGFAKDNEIPWNIPEDFKHFMDTTSGTICVTGKNSYLEMVDMKRNRLGEKYDPSEPILNNRDTYVITSTLSDIHDAVIISSLADFITEYNADTSETRDLFVLGGQQAYIEAMDYVDEIILTTIPGTYSCDRFFPMDSLSQFNLTKTTYLQTNQHGPIPVYYYKR